MDSKPALEHSRSVPAFPHADGDADADADANSEDEAPTRVQQAQPRQLSRRARAMSTPTLPPAVPRRHEAVQLTDSTDVAHARAAVHSKWKGRVATFLSEEKRLEEARSRKVASKTKKGRDG